MLYNSYAYVLIMKTINIPDELHKKLMRLKIDGSFSSISDVIIDALKKAGE